MVLATRRSISRSFSYSVLTEAIAAGDDRKAVGIMQAQPELVNDVDRFGNSPLHIAVQVGSELSVKELIRRGGEINQKNVLGYSPYTWALKIGWQVGADILITGAEESQRSARKIRAVGFAFSESMHKKVVYLSLLVLALPLLVAFTYWYAQIFVTAKEILDYGAQTEGKVTAIYKGTSGGGRLPTIHYRTATVAYLNRYKTSVNGAGLSEGDTVCLTYSTKHRNLSKQCARPESLLEDLQWSADGPIGFLEATIFVPLCWVTWLICLWGYRSGKLVRNKRGVAK